MKSLNTLESYQSDPEPVNYFVYNVIKKQFFFPVQLHCMYAILHAVFKSNHE